MISFTYRLLGSFLVPFPPLCVCFGNVYYSGYLPISSNSVAGRSQPTGHLWPMACVFGCFRAASHIGRAESRQGPGSLRSRGIYRPALRRERLAPSPPDLSCKLSRRGYPDAVLGKPEGLSSCPPPLPGGVGLCFLLFVFRS